MTCLVNGTDVIQVLEVYLILSTVVTGLSAKKIVIYACHRTVESLFYLPRYNAWAILQEAVGLNKPLPVLIVHL